MGDGYGIALVGIFVAGVAISTQAPINARLGSGLGDGLSAAAVSFAVGFAVLLAAVMLRGSVPGMSDIRAVPWWAWFGGALGAYYVWMAIFSVPKLGVLTLTAMLVLGQMVGSMVLDSIGAFGLPVREVDWQRLLAAVMVLGGVVLSMQT